MTDSEKRHATLKALPTNPGVGARETYVILTASNGEPLLYGETHPTKAAGDEARKAVLQAMIEVLEAEGYKVDLDLPSVDPMETFTDPGDPR